MDLKILWVFLRVFQPLPPPPPPPPPPSTILTSVNKTASVALPVPSFMCYRTPGSQLLGGG